MTLTRCGAALGHGNCMWLQTACALASCMWQHALQESRRRTNLMRCMAALGHGALRVDPHHVCPGLSAASVGAEVMTAGSIRTVRLAEGVTNGRASWLHWHRRMAGGAFTSVQQVACFVSTFSP